MPQIKFLTLMDWKNSRKRPLNILYNLMKKISKKKKRKALEKEEQIIEIIKVPKKKENNK